MEEVWGKVTWYSKLLALILFCALPFVGFYLGVKYGEIQENLTTLELQVKENRDLSPRFQQAPVIVPANPAPASTSTQVLDTSGWKTYRNEQYGFEIKYPNNLKLDTDSGIDFTDNTSTGIFSIYNPKIEPSYCHTNAAEVTDCYDDGFDFGIYPNNQKVQKINDIVNQESRNSELDSTFQAGNTEGHDYYLGTLIGPSYVTYFPTEKFFFLIYRGKYDIKQLTAILSTFKFTK